MPAMAYFMQNAEQQNLAKMDKSSVVVHFLIYKQSFGHPGKTHAAGSYRKFIFIIVPLT